MAVNLPPTNVISFTGARTMRGPTPRYFFGRRSVHTVAGSITWSSTETMSGSSRMDELYHPFLTVCQILRTGGSVPSDLDRKKGEALPTDAFRLDGKLAVVTGAAQGIGAAIAMTYAAYGAEVAICDRLPEGLADTAAAITSAGGAVVSSEV